MLRNHRRLIAFALSLTMALGVAALPALADEVLGRIIAVDTEKQTITVIEKGTKAEIVVTIAGETEVYNAKGKFQKKFDLEKFKEKTAKGKTMVKVTHADKVASKLELQPGKKAALKIEEEKKEAAKVEAKKDAPASEEKKDAPKAEEKKDAPSTEEKKDAPKTEKKEDAPPKN